MVECLVRGRCPNFLIVAVESNTGLFEDKLLFDGGTGGVALCHAGGHVAGEFFERADSLVQALAGDGR